MDDTSTIRLRLEFKSSPTLTCWRSVLSSRCAQYFAHAYVSSKAVGFVKMATAWYDKSIMTHTVSNLQVRRHQVAHGDFDEHLIKHCRTKGLMIKCCAHAGDFHAQQSYSSACLFAARSAFRLHLYFRSRAHKGRPARKAARSHVLVVFVVLFRQKQFTCLVCKTTIQRMLQPSRQNE